MSLHATNRGGVPEETARVVRAAFPKGSLAIRIRDELGELFSDEQFAQLYPVRGKPAWSPGRLALVSVLQFAEGLSDRQAADAVRGRLDWKYLLALELEDPGFDHSVLTEFRDRLIAGDAGIHLLDRVLEAATTRGLLRAGGRARTDSTIVLSAARQINGLSASVRPCGRHSTARQRVNHAGWLTGLRPSGLTATRSGSRTPVCPKGRTSRPS